MKIIIWFKGFRRIVKDDFHDWKFAEVEEFVSHLKDAEFIKYKNKYYPTSEIRIVKIK
jgi:hypothetical protein